MNTSVVETGRPNPERDMLAGYYFPDAYEIGEDILAMVERRDGWFQARANFKAASFGLTDFGRLFPVEDDATNIEMLDGTDVKLTISTEEEVTEENVFDFCREVDEIKTGVTDIFVEISKDFAETLVAAGRSPRRIKKLSRKFLLIESSSLRRGASYLLDENSENTINSAQLCYVAREPVYDIAADRDHPNAHTLEKPRIEPVHVGRFIFQFGHASLFEPAE